MSTINGTKNPKAEAAEADVKAPEITGLVKRDEATGTVSLEYKLLGALLYHYRYRVGIAFVALCAATWWMTSGKAPVTNGNGYQYAAQPYAASFAPPPAAAAPAPGAVTFGTNSFTVAKVSRIGNGVWLNSMADHKMSGNQSIHLTGEGAKMQAEGLVGRRVTATGIQRTSKTGGAYLAVNNPAAVRVE